MKIINQIVFIILTVLSISTIGNAQTCVKEITTNPTTDWSNVSATKMFRIDKFQNLSILLRYIHRD